MYYYDTVGPGHSRGRAGLRRALDAHTDDGHQPRLGQTNYECFLI